METKIFLIFRNDIQLFAIGNVKKKYYTDYIISHGIEYAKDQKYICWKLKNKNVRSKKNKDYWKDKLLWSRKGLTLYEYLKGYRIKDLTRST